MLYAPMITSFYVGIAALMLLGLTIYVIKGRFKYKVGVGDGGNEDMLRCTRVQGNFLEYVPILLIMMAIMEINGMQPWILHIYGITLVLSRALHAYGLHNSAGTSPPRFVGMIATFALLLIGGLLCISRYIF